MPGADRAAVRDEAARAPRAVATQPPFRDARAQRGGSAWIDRPLAGGPPGEPFDHLLRRIFATETERALRRIPGRTTLAWPLDGGVIVKRFDAGTLADAAHDLWTIGVARSAARREAENLRELARCGIDVPRALGWCEERHGRGLRVARRSAMWMERVEHRETLRDLAERRPGEAAERRLEPLAQSVARLHSAGWYHRDLYLQHWLVAERGLVLLDVGRCRREAHPRERWFVKDVAQLLHSTPRVVSQRTRLRFLARYLDLRGVAERAARRRFAREVLAKARRIAAHEPRFAYRAPGT